MPDLPRCYLCGNVNPAEIGPYTGTCYDGRACRRRRAGAELVNPDPAEFHWPAWCPHGDGYHAATNPEARQIQARAEAMGSYGRQQEVQARLHGSDDA